MSKFTVHLQKNEHRDSYTLILGFIFFRKIYCKNVKIRSTRQKIKTLILKLASISPGLNLEDSFAFHLQSEVKIYNLMAMIYRWDSQVSAVKEQMKNIGVSLKYKLKNKL